MQKKRTLNYQKQYLIFNPDGTQKAVFSDLFEIADPEGACERELYAVYLKRGAHYGRWAIIDEHGEYIAGAKYEWINSTLLAAGDSFVIEVRKEDGTYNLVNLDGEEVFTKYYRRIGYLGTEVCILRDEDTYGLGSPATGEIIVEPKYVTLEETTNPDLFIFYGDGSGGYAERWGIIDKTGKILFEPRFYSVVWGREWSDYNVALVEADPESGNYRYVVIDWFGKEVYESESTQPYRRYKDNAKNALIFFKEARGILQRKGLATLVIFDYDEDEETERVLEYDFAYGAQERGWKIDYAAGKVISKNGLGELIYTRF